MHSTRNGYDILVLWAKCQLSYSEFQTYIMDMQCSLLNDCVVPQGELASSSQLNHLYLVKFSLAE